MSLRSIPEQLPKLEELGVPPGVLASRGRADVVLITGVRGSGRSTSVAALLTRLAELRDAYVLTVEDPVEHVLSPSAGVVVQREVMTHTASLRDALETVGRVGADIIYMGEIRGTESLDWANSLAESGHLVLATLEATSLKTAVTKLMATCPILGGAWLSAGLPQLSVSSCANG